MAKLKWSGPWRNTQAGEFTVKFSASSKWWTLKRNGETVSRHDRREDAMRKAGRLNAAKSPRKPKACEHKVPWFRQSCDAMVKVCISCRAGMPMGPSNDEPAWVAVEMRAAEMIADVASYGGGEADVWGDDESITVGGGPYQEEFNASLWPWDATRPVAGQYAAADWRAWAKDNMKTAAEVEAERAECDADEAQHEQDDAIRRLRSSAVEGTITDAITRHRCSIALGECGQLDRDPTPEEVAECRAAMLAHIARREEAAPLVYDCDSCGAVYLQPGDCAVCGRSARVPRPSSAAEIAELTPPAPDPVLQAAAARYLESDEGRGFADALGTASLKLGGIEKRLTEAVDGLAHALSEVERTGRGFPPAAHVDSEPDAVPIDATIGPVTITLEDPDETWEQTLERGAAAGGGGK